MCAARRNLALPHGINGTVTSTCACACCGGTGRPCVGEPRYELHRGDFLRLSGALAAARRSYRRGEAAAIRLGMPWETKRCQQALAELSGSTR